MRLMNFYFHAIQILALISAFRRINGRDVGGGSGWGGSDHERSCSLMRAGCQNEQEKHE